jgi:fatty acid desaturase
MSSVDPTRINGILAAVLMGLHIVALIVYPLLRGPIGLSALAVAAILSSTLWGLMHEGIRGRLLENRRANRVVSRLLSIVFGTPFILVQNSHLLHHAVNRTPMERPDVRTRAARIDYPVYYAVILGGIYVGELFMSLAFLTPPAIARKMADRAQGGTKIVLTKLVQKEAFAEMRIDGVLVAALYGFALWHAPIAMLGFIAVRAVSISMLDYPYHYRTKVGDVLFARNLNAGPWRFLLLDFNLHGVHHLRPDLPWTALRRHFEESGGRYDGALVGAVLAQLRGPFKLGDRDQVPS